MNPNTRVAVHCYEGDAHQVRDLMHLYTHHGCPITILSPLDSKVIVERREGYYLKYPNIDCKFGGEREGSLDTIDGRTVSIGPKCLERQRRHMEILLTYPENFFLMHDSDSVCLSPELPEYLYKEPNVLWSNLVYNDNLGEQHAFTPGVPRIALQPPWFMSRHTIESLLAVADLVPVESTDLPFIDFWLMKLALKARIVWKGFPDGISAAIPIQPGVLEKIQVDVRHRGLKFIHSVKSQDFAVPLMTAHRQWCDDYRPIGDLRPRTITDTTYDVRRPGNELARKEQTDES